jgi:uncharacterized protein YdhG (YjbR/CyaY superfamily)
MKPTTIDAYIATFPSEVQPILKKIRATIRKAAPKATESISYQIPAFHLDGQYLIYFAGFKKHVGVYPVHAIVAELGDALKPYLSGKATAKFMLDEKIPYGLITKIVRAKAKAIAGNPKASKKKIVKSRRPESGAADMRPKGRIKPKNTIKKAAKK